MFSWKCPFLMGNWTRVRKRTEACSVKGSNGGPRPSVMVGAQIITRNCIRLGSEHFSMFWSFASFIHNTHWWAYTTLQEASKSMESVRPSCSASSAVLHWSRGWMGGKKILTALIVVSPLGAHLERNLWQLMINKIVSSKRAPTHWWWEKALFVLQSSPVIQNKILKFSFGRESLLPGNWFL